MLLDGPVSEGWIVFFWDWNRRKASEYFHIILELFIISLFIFYLSFSFLIHRLDENVLWEMKINSNCRRLVSCVARLVAPFSYFFLSAKRNNGIMKLSIYFCQ